MVNPNWGLSRGGNSFENAFGVGVQLGQQNKRNNQQNALTQYALNPDDPKAFEGLAQHAPQFAMRERQNQQKRQQEQKFRGLRLKALQGDKGAQQQLAVIDTDAYNRATDDQRKQSDESDKAMAQAVFQLQQLPEQERGQRWDAIATELGADELVGQYSPVAVDAILAKGGVAKAFQEFQRPRYQVIPEGGTLVNTKDPQAVGQFGGAPQPTTKTGGQGGVSQEDGKQIVLNWNKAGYATRDQIETIKSSMGGGQQAVDAYLQKHGIQTIDAEKELNGQTYYQVGGKWFDNPEGR